MITKDNLTEVMNFITEEQINEVMEAKSDYIRLSVSSYGGVRLETVDINDEEKEENIMGTGGLIADKDDFLRLFMESGSLNPFILKYC
ncbi:hypothetical protein [uncultured Clostridium sp.]|uniref:hypothetical protein n=1 Tax=uncultured Clostridium sp. TaxID=59620 RepID=UPI0026204D06|nr:hypothetical protein [uncultured Clostridium sp.]